MCGIVGVVGGSQPQEEQFARACERLAHRGPDGEGIIRLEVAQRAVMLGHRRLAIQDLSDAGRQPMHSHDGRWWVIFNGEIYNHPQLRTQLPGPFNGHSDTETLVEHLASFGFERTVTALNGMFAFAAVDLVDHRVYLARDPFGIKPLYYRFENGGLAFASELRALLTVSGPSRTTLNRLALEAFLTLRFVPSPLTLLEGVFRLEPGHALHFDLDSSARRTTRFVCPVPPVRSVSERQAVLEYRELLQQAVRRQMLSDVPVGILLSGGIDSALLAAFARDAGFRPPSFTVGFEGEPVECEIAQAAETAAVLGLPHHFVRVGQEDLWSTYEDAMAATEEPLGTTSILPMWHLARLARGEVKVALAGQGSDEPWGGYRRYKAELVRALLPGAAALARLAYPLARKLDFMPEVSERGLRAVGVGGPPAERFLAAYTLFLPEERRAMLGASPSEAYGLERIEYWIDALGLIERSPVEQMMSIDLRMNLADDLLLYGDKIAMAHSLEVRVPMLDPDVVQFIESLPRHLRRSLSRTKIVHRALARTYLPQRIVERPKLGFRVPFESLSRSAWRERIEQMLFGVDTGFGSVLDLTSVRRLWEDSLRHGGRGEQRMFSLIGLAIWHRSLRREGFL